MSHAVLVEYQTQTIGIFRMYKALAERAMAQLASDSDVVHALDPDSNSVAVLVKHLRGNMRSRWTDFLTTDGEKPERRREEEFTVAHDTTRAEVLAWWEEGWAPLIATLEQLREEDLSRRIRIRGESHSVVFAIQYQLAHCASHVGQIILLCKHLCADRWITLSVPKARDVSPPPVS